jgi:O-antigen ligase
MNTITKPSEDYNLTAAYGRKAIALRGIGYMMQYPFFGIGIGNFGKAECTISPLALNPSREGFRCVAPHNSAIEAGACLGIGGIVLWIGMLVGGAIGMLRLGRRVPAAWRRGDAEQRLLISAGRFLAVAFIGFGVTSTFVSFAWLEFIYILAAFAAGLYTAVAKRLREDGLAPSAVPGPARRGGQAVVFGGAHPRPA